LGVASPFLFRRRGANGTRIRILAAEAILGPEWVSGIMCRQDRAGVIIMSVEHHLSHHSHYAMMWGYPGNIMKIKFRVIKSTDTNCAVGTVGRATLFGSYNNVRSDSVQFFFPAACRDQDHLYHGTGVNNQVPPL
jgi:hypothetical protein